jgi:DNA-binding SARP family transcriptional activator/EAL domain-containing protein (putative c-di-GMP-specific phosphodiesterase class I)
MGIRIVLLGRLAIERGEAPAAARGTALAGRRSEVVFAFLAAEHRRSVSREELADEVWPEMLPDTWNAALRGVLSDVRRFLEGAGLDPAQTLVADRGRLRFRLPEGAVVDMDEARAALDRAREHLAAGDGAAAAAAAARAADQAALPFLPQHEGPWATDVRSELDELHIRALEVQARALAQAGDPRAAAAAADRLVRADPFSDSAHRLRIELLGAAGDRAGALKAYEQCRALLEGELRIAPSADVDSALERVLDGAAPTPVATGAPAPVGAYSVLVVEDHDFQRRTALTLLRGLGVGTLAEAADGSAALALLETCPAPDIIVCDIDMPGMDGVEFIRHVAERRLASAVAIVSALDARLLETIRTVSEGYGLQVLGAIGKPLSAAALERLLAAYRPPPPGRLSAADGTSAAVARALEDGTLGADFEPIVDLTVGSVSAALVLARWPGTTTGDPLAAVDAAGLGQRLTEHLLARARDELSHLDLDAWVTLPPSLLANVSAADALAAILRDRVVLVVDAASLGRGHNPALLDLLARLRVKGYGLCVDGFEAGRESLERLPLTHAQLPSRLVAATAGTRDGAHAAQLDRALDAARALGVPVVGRCATAAEFELLLQLGCSFARGPFLGPPMPSGQLADRIGTWALPAAEDGPR